MSILDIYMGNIQRKKNEISSLKKDRLRYVNEVSNQSNKIVSAKRNLTSTKSQSTINSKLREIEKAEKNKSDAEKKIAEYDKKISQKETELFREEKKYDTEKVKELKRKLLEERKREVEVNSMLAQHANTQRDLLKEINILKESKEKINILFLASNPNIKYISEDKILEQQKLDLDKEAREIEESIKKSLNRDSINFQTKWAIRTTDIFQYINEVNPTIIHFSGHGTENGELVFQDNMDNPKIVSNEAISEMISATSDEVRLIVFNNCFSSIQANLIVNSVEATIGMNKAIGDNAAITFASQLYSSIGFGLSIDVAFKQAKAQLILEGINEQDTPELYVKEGISSKDIILVKK